MDTTRTADSTQEMSSPEEVAPGQLSTGQERDMYLGVARTRRDMLAGREDALAKVEVERHLVLMVGRGFDRAVSEARAEGFAWEHIVEHVAGFKTAYGAEAAEKLFESMSVFGSRFDERYLSWRCGDCDGLVLGCGPYGGHPADAEPGREQGCGRLATEAAAYAPLSLHRRRVAHPRGSSVATTSRDTERADPRSLQERMVRSASLATSSARRPSTGGARGSEGGRRTVHCRDHWHSRR